MKNQDDWKDRSYSLSPIDPDDPNRFPTIEEMVDEIRNQKRLNSTIEPLRERFPWWRYLVAILAFLAISLLAPLFIFILETITNLFIPEYYKPDQLWMWIVAYGLGNSMAFEQMNKCLLSQKHGFQLVWAIVVIVYAVLTSISNFINSSLNGGVGFIVVLVVAIVFAVKHYNEK